MDGNIPSTSSANADSHSAPFNVGAGRQNSRNVNNLHSNEGQYANKGNESENIKRKKPKTNTATKANNPNYPRDLDAWLENCLKDAATPQLSSSSEFLDYNSSSFNLGKKMPQQPSMMQQHPLFSQGFQKTAQETQNTLYNPFNMDKMLRNIHIPEGDVNVEFTSLPPTVNMGTCENLEQNDPNRSFRFSDPCLLGPSDNDSKLSSQNANQRNLDGSVGNDKFLAALFEQFNLLRETNVKICRNLHETKVELEALKHASNWGGLRHRRDSLSGLSTHSQPMGLAFGTHSPAPTYHSGMYTPGMMTDVVREVKEAARVREEALISRVKSMVEERSWSAGEGNLRLIREIEEMKAHIQHLRSDRKEANKRITQLESENKYIRSLLASILNNRRDSEIIHENDVYISTPMRKTVREPLRSKQNSFNLNYGTINHEEDISSVTMNDNRGHIRKSASMDSKIEHRDRERRSPYINSDLHMHGTNQNGSFPVDDLYATPENEQNPNEAAHILQIEKDTLDLRRELQEALASKKQAENRIIALETMVKRLQIKSSHQHSADNRNTTLHNGATTTTSELSQNNERSPNLNQTSSQISPKLSLAGPITDL